ncbi:MAG: radical SAM protein [Planctomycetota bacterium]|nr:radical SAM protein [Planctomycetota bacterium]
MIQRKKKIVLYQPKQIDETLGGQSSKDMLPLELLTISAYPLQDGYEIEIIDGSLYEGDMGHRVLRDACEGALMVATTGILGYMVTDGWLAMTMVKERYPDMPTVIGGWFASVRPDLQLGTGLYDAVVHGQGELTFRDVVQAIDAGEDLATVSGLSVMRDGQIVRTEHRSVVGWDKILPVPWHMLDIEPYRAHQMRRDSASDVLRMPTPPSLGTRNPYFGITYFSSYGCPEPCTFCCSPQVTDRRWKAMPADRMLDDIEEIHGRWGFDVIRFHDANFGVMQKRVKEFTTGLIDRKIRIGWNAFIETHSILSYKPEVLDLMAESGMYVAEIGAEAGSDDMMRKIGKPIKGDDNVAAAVEVDRRGIQANCTFIIGFPGEEEDSMMKTIDQCVAVHNWAPFSRATVWPFRPIPGTAMWDEAIEQGYVGPNTIREWGSIGEYHLQETWPGRIPSNISEARTMYHHFATLTYGLARGKIGFWERRAQKRLWDGSYKNGRLEARLFSVYDRICRRVFPREEVSRSWVDPGHRTGTQGNERSDAKQVVTSTTLGK